MYGFHTLYYGNSYLNLEFILSISPIATPKRKIKRGAIPIDKNLSNHITKALFGKQTLSQPSKIERISKDERKIVAAFFVSLKYFLI